MFGSSPGGQCARARPCAAVPCPSRVRMHAFTHAARPHACRARAHAPPTLAHRLRLRRKRPRLRRPRLRTSPCVWRPRLRPCVWRGARVWRSRQHARFRRSQRALIRRVWRRCHHARSQRGALRRARCPRLRRPSCCSHPRALWRARSQQRLWCVWRRRLRTSPCIWRIRPCVRRVARVWRSPQHARFRRARLHPLPLWRRPRPRLWRPRRLCPGARLRCPCRLCPCARLRRSRRLQPRTGLWGQRARVWRSPRRRGTRHRLWGLWCPRRIHRGLWCPRRQRPCLRRTRGPRPCLWCPRRLRPGSLLWRTRLRPSALLWGRPRVSPGALTLWCCLGACALARRWLQLWQWRGGRPVRSRCAHATRARACACACGVHWSAASHSFACAPSARARSGRGRTRGGLVILTLWGGGLHALTLFNARGRLGCVRGPKACVPACMCLAVCARGLWRGAWLWAAHKGAVAGRDAPRMA